MLEHSILLLSLPKCWDYRGASLCLAKLFTLVMPVAQHQLLTPPHWVALFLRSAPVYTMSWSFFTHDVVEV
jgi:hypothetical protein